MRRKDIIYQLLEKEFSPEFLEVLDESYQHAGHASAPEGGESHFRIRIKTGVLDKLSRVAAHRKIYETLSDIMPDIHALAIEL